MTDKTVDAFIERDFKDAGTEQHFEGGKVQPLTEGQFINFKAAGLVRVPTEDEAKAAKEAEKPTAATKTDPETKADGKTKA